MLTHDRQGDGGAVGKLRARRDLNESLHGRCLNAYVHDGEAAPVFKNIEAPVAARLAEAHLPAPRLKAARDGSCAHSRTRAAAQDFNAVLSGNTAVGGEVFRARRKGNTQQDARRCGPAAGGGHASEASHAGTAAQEEQQGNYWKRDKWAMHIVESSPSCAPLCRGTGPVQRL